MERPFGAEMGRGERAWRARGNAGLRKLAPLGAFVAAALFFFWPLLGGRRHLVPFHVLAGDPFLAGLDVQADRPDWRTYDLSPVATFYAEKALCASCLRRGELPLWNPYNGLGFPLLGDGQSQPFAPFFLPFLLRPTPWVYSWCLVLQLIFGALGMERLLRLHAASAVVRLAGSLAFAFNPYTLKFATYSNVWAYVWVPWLFLLAEKMATSGGWRMAFAVCVAAASASGHMEEVFWAAAWAFIYFVLRAHSAGGWRSWCNLRSLGPASGALCLSAWWVFPFVEWVLRSWSPRMDSFRAIAYSPASPFLSGSELLWPPLLLPLAGLGLVRNRVARAVLPAFVWSLLLMFPFPSLLQALLSFGFMSGRYARSMAWFSLVLMAAIGLQAWWEESPSARLRWTGVCLQLSWMGAAGVLALAQGGGAASAPEDRVPLVGASAAASPVCWALWAAGILLWSLPPLRSLARRQIPLAGLAVCVVGWTSMSPPSEWASWNASRPELAPQVVAVSPKDGRQWFPVRGAFMDLTPNLAGAFAVRDLRYVQPLTPKSLVPVAGRLGFGFQGFREITPEIAAFAGVCNVWVEDTRGPSPALKALEVAGQAPRGLWVPEARSAATAQEALAAALKEQSWRRTVFLLGKSAETGSAPGYAPATGNGTSELLDDECTRSRWSVRAPGPGWFVLRDLDWPGWRALVDEKPARVLTADGIFRAVQVGAGIHTVDFFYRPLSWMAGCLTTLLCACLILGVAIGRGVRAAREGREA